MSLKYVFPIYGQTPGWADIPTQCMLGYTPPLPSAWWDTIKKRAVRIPLEFILVLIVSSHLTTTTATIQKTHQEEIKK